MVVEHLEGEYGYKSPLKEIGALVLHKGSPAHGSSPKKRIYHKI